MAKRDRKLIASRIALFVKKFARKAQPGRDPNDRAYDRKVEKIIRKMKPEDLDRHLHNEEE